MLNVKLISMNYENVYGYLCFCCADAVDCGGWGVLDLFTLTFDSSPIKGEGELVGCVGLVSPVPPCRHVDTALKPV